MPAFQPATKATCFLIAATCLSAIAFLAETRNADTVPGHAVSHDLVSGVVCAMPVAATGSAPQNLDENECPETDTRVIGGVEVEGQFYDVNCIGINIPLPWWAGSVECESCTCKYFTEFNPDPARRPDFGRFLA